ncbi:MAG: hypothetical protein PHQ59_04500 [Candidatus Daviesbacteria bacterium]|nr:hypothetical protein [Candidatus Daviesbacteria bacterium]
MLLLKNPYSDENIISDFLPLPDAIHYVTPARSLALGFGLNLYYEGRSASAAVPPLYSLYLAPYYLINNDARTYYFANVVLSLLSAVLFYLLLSKLKLNPILKVLSFFAFCTNIALYWYPSAAMAENLFLFLYLLSVWLLISEVNKRNIIVAGLVVICLYATKYVEIIVSGILAASYFLKISLSIKNKKKLITSLFIFILSITVPLLFFDLIEYYTKGSHIWPLSDIFRFFNFGVTGSSQLSLPLVGYMDIANIDFNLYQYLAGILGGELTTAGQGLIIASPIIGMLGLIGLFLNPFNKEYRLITSYFLLTFMSTLIFCLFFYIVEGRYIFFVIPVLILSFAIFVDRLWIFFQGKDKLYLIYLTAVIIAGFILFSQVPPVVNELTGKNNLIKGDSNRLVIKTLNSSFKGLTNSKKVVIISVIPPYLFDYYEKPNYKLLPLSQRQVFMGIADAAWGTDDYSDLINLYRKYLNSGYSLYVSAFKTDPNFVYSFDLMKINYYFRLDKVADGCDGKCNLYKVSLK